MTRTAEVTFLGFTAADDWTLRADFDIEAQGARFRATARVIASGQVVDLQASDRLQAGTTGDEAIDALLARIVTEELARARSTHAVMEFDARRRRRGLR